MAVVGAGPAGLMAAERLAGAGCGVTLYDRMPSPARKLLLAGRGGLNITHSEPLERFVGQYSTDAVGAHVRAFPPEALRAWCAGLGQPTIVGSSGRVFPAGWKATPLVRAWLARLGGLGVVLRPGHRWVGWDGEGLRFETAAGGAVVRADAAVLALGGASWPRLGSDGAWTEAFGDGVAPLRPANCGFVCAWPEGFVARHGGQPLKRVAARFGGREVRGEAVVTASGIEGGVVYAHAAALREAIAAEGDAVLELDLRPDLDRAALAGRLGGPAVSMANALRRGGVEGAAGGVVRMQDKARPLVERIKAARLRLVGTQPLARAISTAGGVRFEALDGLMLRGRPGMFVAGEMLDWEAPTGGYLLQGCFATGWAAAGEVLGWLGVPS